MAKNLIVSILYAVLIIDIFIILLSAFAFNYESSLFYAVIYVDILLILILSKFELKEKNKPIVKVVVIIAAILAIAIGAILFLSFINVSI